MLSYSRHSGVNILKILHDYGLLSSSTDFSTPATFEKAKQVHRHCQKVEEAKTEPPSLESRNKEWYDIYVVLSFLQSQQNRNAYQGEGLSQWLVA